MYIHFMPLQKCVTLGEIASGTVDMYAVSISDLKMTRVVCSHGRASLCTATYFPLIHSSAGLRSNRFVSTRFYCHSLVISYVILKENWSSTYEFSTYKQCRIYIFRGPAATKILRPLSVTPNLGYNSSVEITRNTN